MTEGNEKERSVRSELSLTVSESKRLIAKGTAAAPVVQTALAKGIVVIATGSTNSYVVEEIMGQEIDKTAYRSGLTLPSRPARKLEFAPEIMPDVVLRDGVQDPSLDRFSALAHLGAGDVFIKGANALNHSLKQCGILIGDPNGGTIGAAIGNLVGRRARLVMPVGLEKSVNADLHETARYVNEPDDWQVEYPHMMTVTGDIITEIEALNILAGVTVRHMASGGVGGAEGAVWLSIEGSKQALERTSSIIDTIRGEPPWI